MHQKLKSLATETSVYGIFTVLNRLMSFVLTPIYSNYLSVEQFDYLIYLFSFSTFLSVLYSFGMEGAFLRYFDSKDENKSKQAFSFAYIVVNLAALSFTLVITLNSEYLVNVSGYSSIPEASSLLILAAFIPFLDVLTYIPFTYLRATNKAFKLSVIRFSVILISLVLHFYLLSKFDYQAEGALIAQNISNFVAFLLLLSVIINNLTFNIDIDYIKRMMRFAIASIPAALFAVFLQVADRPILKLLTNSEIDITTYQVNYRLGIPMLIFVSVFDYAWQPFYLKHFKDNDSPYLFGKILTYYTLVSGFIFLIISFFMELIVRIPFPGGTLINSIYWDGLIILPIIISAYYFYGLYVNFSASAIIGHKPLLTAISLLIAVVVNLSSNFILVPIYGYIGSAYSILLAYFSASISIYFLSNKQYKVNYEWQKLLKIIFSVSIVYFIDLYLKQQLSNIFFIIVVRLFELFLFLLILRILGFLSTSEIKFVLSLLRRK